MSKHAEDFGSGRPFNSSDSSLPSDGVSTVTVYVLASLLSFTSCPVSLLQAEKSRGRKRKVRYYLYLSRTQEHTRPLP